MGYKRGSGVLQMGSGVLHGLARAVVPPPRLRAKWVAFSASLQPTQNSAGLGALARSCCGKSLRNPAKVGTFSVSADRGRACRI